MKQIILLSGKQGSGKTTTLNALKNKLSSFGVVENVRFSAVLYKMHDVAMEVALKYGIDVPRDKNSGSIKDGPFLQIVGTEWGRNTKGQDVWVNATKKLIIGLNPGNSTLFVLIDDARFVNEFHAFDEMNEYSVLKVRLSAPKDVRMKRCSQWRDNDSHPSEVELDQYELDGKFDLVVRTDVMDTNQVVEKIMMELVARGN